MAPRTDLPKQETEEERKVRQRNEVEAYELANEIVPGTASHRGDGPGQGPSGGTTWEGRARMAAARKAAGLPLDADDRLALAIRGSA